MGWKRFWKEAALATPPPPFFLKAGLFPWLKERLLLTERDFRPPRWERNGLWGFRPDEAGGCVAPRPSWVLLWLRRRWEEEGGGMGGALGQPEEKLGMSSSSSMSKDLLSAVETQSHGKNKVLAQRVSS